MDLEELARQLKKPQGETGLEVAAFMNKGNLIINYSALEALDIQEGDEVLEIGMGNGYLVKEIVSKAPCVHYTGVDFSDLMVEEARRLNQDFVMEKKASFIQAEASHLDFKDHFFSKIFTVNTIYFWDNPEKELAEIKRVLNKEGKFVLAIRSKAAMNNMPFTKFGFRKYDPDEISKTLTHAGFNIVSLTVEKEPPTLFNGQPMELENVIMSCTH